MQKPRQRAMLGFCKQGGRQCGPDRDGLNTIASSESIPRNRNRRNKFSQSACLLQANVLRPSPRPQPQPSAWPEPSPPQLRRGLGLRPLSLRPQSCPHLSPLLLAARRLPCNSSKREQRGEVDAAKVVPKTYGLTEETLRLRAPTS